MDEYKTRLYAIACRAPITEVHKSAVKECPLYTQFKERKKLRDSRVEYVVGLLKDHCKWISEQGIMVRQKFSQFVLLDYSLISDDDFARWVGVTSCGRVTLAQKLYMSYKQAHAALAYAEAIINTPEEYLTLALPVNEDIPRAILSLPEHATQMQKCIDELFDEGELSSLEALVETVVQEAKEQEEKKREKSVVEKLQPQPSAPVVKQEEECHNNVFPAALTFLGLLGLALYLIF